MRAFIVLVVVAVIGEVVSVGRQDGYQPACDNKSCLKCYELDVGKAKVLQSCQSVCSSVGLHGSTCKEGSCTCHKVADPPLNKPLPPVPSSPTGSTSSKKNKV